MITLTPEQRGLARHALGLTRGCGQSYRNNFVTGAGSTDYPKWLDMVAVGAATRTPSKMFGGDDLFRLTRAGAEAALDPGERLCPEDFPS